MDSINLHEFVTAHRDEIIGRCRANVARRTMPPPTEAEINHGVPLFLDQLVDALRMGTISSAAIGSSALLHGHDLLLKGFTLTQVVHDYGDVCQSITELAMESGARIEAGDFRLLNACLDDAIAGAVTQYSRERDQTSADGESARGTERLGFLAHELRNLLNTALLAFEVLKSGDVGVRGSTGTVLHRSLTNAGSLIDRALAEVRLSEGIQNRQQLSVSDLVADVAAGARLTAVQHHVRLDVTPIEEGLAIYADPQVLAAVILNLLQNAFKFTRPNTAVTLRVGASAERVLFEIQDECGGLPSDVDGLFRPFEQRGADRTGLGLGLAFSRWAVEANQGRIYARTVADSGCVFTIDLPRSVVPATAGYR